MKTISFREDDVKAYLDKCILHWRKRRHEGSRQTVLMCDHYIDAFQSVRISLFGEVLPKDRSEGCRVYPDEHGTLHLAEGDYGLHPTSGWQVRPPGCHAGGIGKHEVTEHEDGTITVSPSILLTDFDEDSGQPKQWHGYLERGVWREV
jgi:hypothetical protein